MILKNQNKKKKKIRENKKKMFLKINLVATITAVTQL